MATQTSPETGRPDTPRRQGEQWRIRGERAIRTLQIAPGARRGATPNGTGVRPLEDDPLPHRRRLAR